DDVNEVSLVGRITKDPLLRQLPSGKVQSSFVLAVNRNYKNQEGSIDTDFILCTNWGRLAENTVRFCGKGSLIGVAGRIQSRSYERTDKSRAYVTEIIGEKSILSRQKKEQQKNIIFNKRRKIAQPTQAKTRTEDRSEGAQRARETRRDQS